MLVGRLVELGVDVDSAVAEHARQRLRRFLGLRRVGQVERHAVHDRVQRRRVVVA